MIEVNDRQLLAIEEVSARISESRNRAVADLGIQLEYDSTENSADSIIRAAAHLRKTQAVTNTAKRLQAQLKGLLGTRHAMNVTPAPFKQPTGPMTDAEWDQAVADDPAFEHYA